MKQTIRESEDFTARTEQDMMFDPDCWPTRECDGCRSDSWCRGGECANNVVPTGARAE